MFGKQSGLGEYSTESAIRFEFSFKYLSLGSEMFLRSYEVRSSQFYFEITNSSMKPASQRSEGPQIFSRSSQVCLNSILK